MDPELVIEGQQILYTNQFDQLTYNADKIVQMTSQLDDVLKRFSYAFSSKDSALIINKNLTPYLYWLIIDALFFAQNTSYQIDRINYIRKKKNSNKSSSSSGGQQCQDQKFIMKMRLLVVKNHNYQQLNHIKATSIQQLIELLENEFENISQKNDEIINKLSTLVVEEKQRFVINLRKYGVQPQEASPLMAYYNFQKQMIRQWMDQLERKKYGPKCQVCSRTDRLIKCRNCDMQVHAYCYSKLPKNYLQKDFLCQNCQKQLNQKTSCIYCPIKGGQFLEVQCPSQKRTIYTISKSDNMKIKVKKCNQQKQRHFIHLSCSLWHSQIEYNIQKGMIQNIHRVEKKKNQNSCFQCGTNIGVTIPCANQNCRRYYHPQCARLIDLSKCILNAKNKTLLELYCQRHRRSYSFQILKQNILNNLKQIKKLYQGIDHQIKRMACNSYPSDRKLFVKNQDSQRYDWCLYCRCVHDDLQIPITNCWKCSNWYHKQCGNHCPNCQQTPTASIRL